MSRGMKILIGVIVVIVAVPLAFVTVLAGGLMAWQTAATVAGPECIPSAPPMPEESPVSRDETGTPELPPAAPGCPSVTFTSTSSEPFQPIGEGDKIFVTRVFRDGSSPDRVVLEGLEVEAQQGPFEAWVPVARQRRVILDQNARLMTFKKGSTTKYEVGKVADLSEAPSVQLFRIEGPLDAPTGVSELYTS